MIQMDGIFLHGVLHDSKWIMSRGSYDIAFGLSKRGRSNVKLGVIIINHIVIGF